ncbi:ABC transporter ATP-binding protein [Roseomonas sp. BN140053]|uniref:ABC transporter ATP-binding protein n=1 Tax=Roseomonas sp. BN140053 TaxID=3391898 RepID=UPI0039EB72B6
MSAAGDAPAAAGQDGPGRDGQAAGGLEVAGLVAGYGAAEALRGVSLRVAAGECLLLLGRNGAGKSTTLKTVMGVLRPRTGTLRFEGRDLSALPPHRIARAGLGWVPEDRRVFAGLSVAENLEAGRRPGSGWDRARALALFPELEPLLRRDAARLSGGEQQMLAIARTLMGGPRLLLLDEPSEGLAPVVLDRLAEALAALRRDGLSMLVAEGNLPFARGFAERCAVLDRGTVAFEGPLATLLADAALRERLLSA